MALQIVAGLGALGTAIATLVPFFTNKPGTETKVDPSAGAISSFFSNLRFASTSANTLQTEEDKIIESLDRTYIEMNETLRRAVYTQYMVKTYIPNALLTRSENRITNIEDIYTNLDRFKQDPFLTNLIFEKFAGFLKYRKPYLRIMDNFLAQYKRLKSLKDQIQKIYDEASKINTQKLDIPPEQAPIKGGDFPAFIKSEIAILYEEFTDGYEIFRQYRDRLSNFYKLIQKKSFDELPVFEVSKTDISDYIGEDKGILLWSTDQNVEEATKTIDNLESKRMQTIMCLSKIATQINTWLNQIKSSKNLLIISIKGIIEKEKEQIEAIIKDTESIFADLTAQKAKLDEYKKGDKLDDAKLALQTLKGREKKYKALVDNINMFESRMISYASTITSTGEINISYIPCNLSSDKKGDSSVVPSVAPSGIPAGSSGVSSGVGSSSTSSASEDSIGSKLNKINFASAEDKESAENQIEAFSNILGEDLPNYLDEIKDEYEKIKYVEKAINSNKDIFGVNLYNVPDKRLLQEITNIFKD